MIDVAIDSMGAEEGITAQEYFNRWRDKNQTDFFTKIVPKFIPKQIDLKAEVTVESLLEEADAADRAMLIEGESRVVERD